MQQQSFSSQQSLELYDIYGMYYHPWWLEPWFVTVTLCVCVGLCLSVLLYWWYTRKSSIQKTYWDKASEQLQAIANECNTASKNQLSSERMRLLYALVTDIIKKYVIVHFALKNTGATDQEFLALVKNNHAIPSWLQEDLFLIFKNATVIKFSHVQTTYELLEQAVIISDALVQKTKPKKD